MQKEALNEACQLFLQCTPPQALLAAKCLKKIKEFKLAADIYLTAGKPYEAARTLEATVRLLC